MHLHQNSNKRRVLTFASRLKPLAIVALSLTLLITFFGVSFAGNSTLGNFVWYDTNANGIKDEPAGNGINGVVINLYEDLNFNGAIDPGEYITTTVTMNEPVGENGDDTADGEPGFYVFNDVDGETAYLVEIDPNNFQPGGPLEGHDYTGDLAGNPYNGDELRFVAMPDLINDHQDADFSYVTHSLGNYVWLDADNSGDVTAGELPVANGVPTIKSV